MANDVYVSSNIQNGVSFDELVRNLLAYNPSKWGYTEQDYNEIKNNFGVPYNHLCYLPAGNYRIKNLENSPFNSTYVNISVFDKGTDKYVTCNNGGNTSYRTIVSTKVEGTPSSPEWENITSAQIEAIGAAVFYIGTSAPVDKSMLWIDTSKLATDDEVYLKYYNGSLWVSYSFSELMDSSIYDPRNVRKDPYDTVVYAIEGFLNDYSKLTNHKNNEMELIHITPEQKESFNSGIVTTDYVENYYDANGNLFNELAEYITTKISSIVGFDTSDKISELEEIEEGFKNHVGSDSNHSHITTEDAARWDSKSDGDHTHTLDGKVTVSIDDVYPTEDARTFDSSKFNDGVKERIYQVDDLSVLASKPSDADLAGKYHNGNTLYTVNDNDTTTWLKIVDNSQFGKTDFRGIENKISDTTRTWQGICYGNGVFVAVAQNHDKFMYSTDGITWNEANVNARSWRGICYGNGKFVTVSASNNIAAYSTDGINWNETIISDTHRYWRHVCYGNGKFVALSGSVNLSNTFAYSTDGITWTEVTVSGTMRNWWNICYGDGKFVAVVYDNTIFAYSTDGITWTEVIVSEAGTNWRGICYGNGKFVATGFKVQDGKNVPAVAYSTNAISWTEELIEGAYGILNNICYGDKFVASVNNTNKVAYSTDGITWVFKKATGNLNNRQWQYVCYGNEKYIMTISNESIFGIFADNTPIYQDGLELFGTTITDVEYSDIMNKPTTIAGYGIEDAVSTEDLNTIDNEINNQVYFKYTLEGYDKDTVAGNDLYIGIQKTLKSSGGGTDAYPMGTEYSDLDIIMVIDKNSDLTSNVDKFICKNDGEIYSEAGLDKIITNIPASTYFASLYDTDNANTKWDSDGLGRMIKVDTSVNSKIIDTVFAINDIEYTVTISWDTDKGIVVDIQIDKLINSSQNILDRLNKYELDLNNSINSYAAINAENTEYNNGTVNSSIVDIGIIDIMIVQ